MNTAAAIKLIEECEQNGYSLTLIAKQLGVTNQTLGRLKSGKAHRLTQKTAQRLVAFYGFLVSVKGRNIQSQ